MKHLIGLPYDEWNCWDLTRRTQQDLFGIDLPEIQVPDELDAREALLTGHRETNKWRRVEEPQHGDIALMSKYDRVCHIGTYIDAEGITGILHTTQATGGRIHRVEELQFIRLKIHAYYRRNDR